MSAQTLRRPVLITIAVVLVYITGFVDAASGILILLSRYDVPTADVLLVSLVGSGVILFGLLVLAVAGGLGHGSKLSRLLVTIYLGAELILHVITIVGTDWDWTAWVGAALDVFILVVIWVPVSSRTFFQPFDPLRT